jgi:hypothetical protein
MVASLEKLDFAIFVIAIGWAVNDFGFKRDHPAIASPRLSALESAFKNHKRFNIPLSYEEFLPEQINMALNRWITLLARR